MLRGLRRPTEAGESFSSTIVKPHALERRRKHSLENCRVRCTVCHLKKTMDDDMPAIRTADRKAKVKKQLIVADGDPEIMRRFR